MQDPSTHTLPHHTNTLNWYQNTVLSHCLTHTPPNDSDKAKGVYNPMKCNDTLAYRYQYVNYPVKHINRGKGRKNFKEGSDKVYMLVAIMGKNRKLKMPDCRASLEG